MEVIFVGDRKDNIYTIDVENFSIQEKCFSTLKDDSWLWHRRLGHASISTISTFSKKNLVNGLPSLVFEIDKVCDTCQFGKQVKISFKLKKFISSFRPLQQLHMDLFRLSRTASLGGKHYAFVIVDDFNFKIYMVLVFGIQR